MQHGSMDGKSADALRLALEDGHGEHILPFFWQHGEPEPVLREEMRRIQECGIGAVCVEARPHPDFAGPGWWRDLDVVLDEARRRGMRVWVLDDAQFPTGFANGALRNAPAELRRLYLRHASVEVSGPLPSAEFDIGFLAQHHPDPFAHPDPFTAFRGHEQRRFDDDRLQAVVAVRLHGTDPGEPRLIELTDRVSDGRLLWDVPPGAWSLQVMYRTRSGGGATDFIHIIDRDSVRVLIDAVYEPHYERYAADFGKTFAGFFYDEPCFGNTPGIDPNARIGRPDLSLPWSDEVEALLRDRLGADWTQWLPALWLTTGDANLDARIRHAYMDVVSDRVRRHFSEPLGAWCAAHGVESIGHVIEDGHAYSRLGSGLGHYYRAMLGQHMAGIDIVHANLLPGGEDAIRGGFLTLEGEFCHFGLAKLGSSLGHIDPSKKGRSLCELYGAYGWDLSIAQMKWIADHMLVRGINHFVPHAFSAKAYPDPDCPPHFYAQGRNPQFRHFGKLMRYVDRLCRLLDGGVHVAPVALLCSIESDWTGAGMPFEKVARRLAEAQIDFDVVPADVFAEPERYRTRFDGSLRIHEETFRALVVPAADHLPASVAGFAQQASRAGFEVVLVDRLPASIVGSHGSEHREADAGPDPRTALEGCAVVPLAGLADHLVRRGVQDVRIEPAFEGLRVYRYENGRSIALLFNEDASRPFEGTVRMPWTGSAFLYDADANAVQEIEGDVSEDGLRLRLRLEPYRTVAVVSGDPPAEAVRGTEPSRGGTVRAIEGPWQVSFASALDYPSFHGAIGLDRLENLGRKFPGFSGYLAYETEFVSADGSEAFLEIDGTLDGIEAWINGRPAGMAIAPPYRIPIGGLVRQGVNAVRIELATTPDREVRALPDDNPFAAIFPPHALGPLGIVGTVAVRS